MDNARIKWTDDLVRQKVFEVVSGLELKRMPSKNECDNYFQNYALSNVITKKFGWYKLADTLKLSIKNSETTYGKKQELIAFNQLIERGYTVERMPQNYSYDLLVNSCIKVDVKISRLYNGKFSFYSFNLEKRFSTCDIYMLYYKRDDDDEAKLLILPSKFVPYNTQISVGEISSKYHKFLNRWDYIEQYADFLKSVV